MTSSNVRVLHHDNCFDGIASAAVFSVFYRSTIDADASFEYQGLTHQAGSYRLEDALTGTVNVIVDFKYSSSERLTWWFDHHASAFLSPEDEAHFRNDRSGRKFHDPTFRSCTKYIARIGEKVFNCDLKRLDDLIYWADIIDGAQFEDAESAVELREPALKLMLVIESVRDPGLIRHIIRSVQSRTLAEVIEDPAVRPHFDRLYEKHLESIAILREAMASNDGVVEFDISETPISGHNKFIPYHLFPESVYTVGVSLEASRAKVSVGTNPWSRVKPGHNLARICERYGGGGHAVVAAISFRTDQLEEARRVAREIADALRSGPGDMSEPRTPESRSSRT